ncbi:hypothetical+protein [Methylocapsa aurea]|jgi:hypothetical protein
MEAWGLTVVHIGGLTLHESKTDWVPGPGMRVVETKRQEVGWIVSGVTTAASGCCPGCGSISTLRRP